MDIASSSTGSAKFMAHNNRRRLKQEALDILEDFFQEVSQSPNIVEKKALLERIKAIPGCRDYDIFRMGGWFTSRRRRRSRLQERKERKEQSPHLDNNNDHRFPSLTPAAIQHLTVLANCQLNPSSELLKTWATLLASSGAKEQDVVNWIHHRNQDLQSVQHLPTPSNTMTPEPSATSLSPTQSTFPRLYKQETIASPVVPALRIHPYEYPRATPSEPSPTLLPTPNNDPTLQLNQHPRVLGLQAIIHGVCDALASPQTTPNASPKTAAEFEEMFSPFEQRISLLLRALEAT